MYEVELTFGSWKDRCEMRGSVLDTVFADKVNYSGKTRRSPGGGTGNENRYRKVYGSARLERINIY
jgi:hypothetical protein